VRRFTYNAKASFGSLFYESVSGNIKDGLIADATINLLEQPKEEHHQ
jgi:hypothetical protein